MRYWKIKALLGFFLICFVIYSTYFTVTYDRYKIHPYSEVIAKALYNGEILCYKNVFFSLTYQNKSEQISMLEVCNAFTNSS